MKNKLKKLIFLLNYLNLTMEIWTETMKPKSGRGWNFSFNKKTKEIEYTEFDVLDCWNIRNETKCELPELVLNQLIWKYEQWAINAYEEREKQKRNKLILKKIYKEMKG